MYRLLLLAPLFVAGCNNLPASLVPLESDAELKLPHSIAGTWRLRSAKPKTDRSLISFGALDDVTVRISRRSKSKYLLVLLHQETEVSLEGEFCQIDDELFLTLRHPSVENPALAGTTVRPHFFAKCTFSADSLRLTGCDSYAFKNLLEEEGLPSTVIDSKIIYTGSAAQLRDLFRDHAAKLFPPGRGDVILHDRSDVE